MRPVAVFVGMVLCSLLFAGEAVAFRSPTASELEELTVIGREVVGPKFERLVEARVSADGRWASAGTEADAVTPKIFFERRARSWALGKASSGCLYPKELGMPKKIALELGACKELPPEVWENFGVGTQNTGHQHPRTLYLDNQAAHKLRWRRWGEPVTIGKGVLPLSDCDPDCGSGTIIHWPITVRLSQIRKCQGVLFYTRLFIRLPTRSHIGPIRETVDCEKALGLEVNSSRR